MVKSLGFFFFLKFLYFTYFLFSYDNISTTLTTTATAATTTHQHDHISPNFQATQSIKTEMAATGTETATTAAAAAAVAERLEMRHVSSQWYVFFFFNFVFFLLHYLFFRLSQHVETAVAEATTSIAGARDATDTSQGPCKFFILFYFSYYTTIFFLGLVMV